MKLRLGLAGVALAVGCTTTTGGQPGPAGGPSITASPTFDACTAIPDEVVAAFGADPVSKMTYSNPGANQESGCRWRSTELLSSGIGPAYSINVGVVRDAPAAYLLSDQFTATETSIAGRQVANFTANAAENLCNLAVAIDGGSVIVAVVPSLPSLARDKTCGIATNVATTLSPLLP